MQVSAMDDVESSEPNQVGARPMGESSGRHIMNHSIITADRNTHVKMVVVALVAAIMVVTVGIAAHLRSTGVELAGVAPERTVKVGVVKPSQNLNWTARDGVMVR